MAIGLVVVFGALALAVDYSEMSRRRKEMQSALDAAALATGREMIKVFEPAKLNVYASDFFQQNLPTVPKQDVALTLILPAKGGDPVRLCAKLMYRPFILPAVNLLLGRKDKAYEISTCSTVAMRNTIEVALVLDNSGSMSSPGIGSGKARIDVLKSAGTQLVDMLGTQASGIKQLAKPVQLALVPFDHMVNIGWWKAHDSYMDTLGISPVQHEKFDWSAIRDGALDGLNLPKKRVEFKNGAWYMAGPGWPGSWNTHAMTRVELFYFLNLGWDGCMESRPSPYDVNDAPPVASKPETLYVTAFQEDRPGNDYIPDDKAKDSSGKVRPPRDMTRYLLPPAVTIMPGYGPNQGCILTPITPLTDISTVAGRNTMKAAINAMKPNGMTNVPEAMAWGWRVLSHGEPFTEGRPDDERGNDKVVIVLTDGANTYSVDSGSHGRADQPYGTTGVPRLFLGTKAKPSDQSLTNMAAALNEKFAALCKNAKAVAYGRPTLTVMTIALDLDSKKADEGGQIKLLEDCASPSRNDPNKKLFWNATTATLTTTFKDIADALSNLRVVQ